MSDFNANNLPFDLNNMPKHVAIIMDGNGRWAKQKGLIRLIGHQNGVKAVRSSVEFARKYGIKSLTLYAFSSENWSRPEQEVSGLMDLFIHALEREAKRLHKHNICLRIIGDVTKFSHKLQAKIAQVETLTANNDGLILNVAANYGGQWDITQAVNRIIQDVQEQKITGLIDSQLFQSYLTTQEQDPVDLVIRTSGEMRISNFLLWQIAYAELFFTDVLWPDFDQDEFANAIVVYQQRSRRFGGSA